MNRSYLLNCFLQEQIQCLSSADGDLDPACDATVTSSDLARDDEVLDMEPLLKPRPKLLSLDEKTLLNVARANVLSQITVRESSKHLLNILKGLYFSKTNWFLLETPWFNANFDLVLKFVI